MGDDYSRSFTEAGVKRFCQFFIMNILSIFFIFILILFYIAILGSITSLSVDPQFGAFAYRVALSTIFFIFSAIAIWIAFDGMLRISLFATVMICWGLSIIIGILLIIMQLIIIFIILFLLIWGISYLTIGWKEFGKKHQVFVIIAFCLAISYFILYIINLVLYGITANLALSFSLYTDSNLYSQILSTAVILSLVLPILATLAFVLFIFNLSKQRKLLFIAFILGILAPFTFSITGIISLFMFYICYNNVQGNLQTERVKPNLQVPCPFCNREIPIDSKSCKYCGKVFNVSSEQDKFNF